MGRLCTEHTDHVLLEIGRVLVTEVCPGYIDKLSETNIGTLVSVLA